MSQWTHVSGCIRIDGMPQIAGTNNPMHDYAAVLGRPSNDDYSLGGEHGPAENIPAGSEGSIQYHATKAGNGLVWQTVAVWGDLRDFGAEDTPEIDAWFARIVASPLMLRAASLLVEVESGVRYMLIADDEKAVRRVELSVPAAPAEDPTDG